MTVDPLTKPVPIRESQNHRMCMNMFAHQSEDLMGHGRNANLFRQTYHKST